MQMVWDKFLRGLRPRCLGHPVLGHPVPGRSISQGRLSCLASSRDIRSRQRYLSSSSLPPTSAQSRTVLDVCPPPTCPCRERPHIPEGLPLERFTLEAAPDGPRSAAKRRLEGTVPFFDTQILICSTKGTQGEHSTRGGHPRQAQTQDTQTQNMQTQGINKQDLDKQNMQLDSIPSDANRRHAADAMQNDMPSTAPSSDLEHEQWPSRIESDPDSMAAILRSLLNDRRLAALSSQSPRDDLSRRSISILNTTLPALSPPLSDGRNDYNKQGSSTDIHPRITRSDMPGRSASNTVRNAESTATGKPHSKRKASMIIFPAFVEVECEWTREAAEEVLERYVVRPVADGAQPSGPTRACPVAPLAGQLRTARVEDPLILVCGHMARDLRCGRMGPVLRDEFIEKLQRTGRRARVGLVSHVGGHKYAGNVLLYLPPTARMGALGLGPRHPGTVTNLDDDPRDCQRQTESVAHPLAGCTVWYGCVDPWHVEGILRETVGRGVLIRELFRGGFRQNLAPLTVREA